MFLFKIILQIFIFLYATSCAHNVTSYVHNGCIKGDCHNGHGTFVLDDGSQYSGEWRDGLMHGQGTKTWANGAKYVGEWKDDNMNGQGTYTWANGNQSSGEWKDGKMLPKGSEQ